MAKSIIVAVNINGDMARVAYATGTEKTYPIDKLPRTVQAWLDEQNRKPDPEMVREFVKETFPELFQPVKEWIGKTKQEEKPEQERINLDDDSQTAYLDLYATWYEPQPEPDLEPELEVVELKPSGKDLPEKMQKPELTVPVASRRASEAVALWICMAFAILAHGLIELVSFLAIMIDTGWTLAKPRARAGVRWIRETGYPTATAGFRTAARQLATAVWYLYILVI